MSKMRLLLLCLLLIGSYALPGYAQEAVAKENYNLLRNYLGTWTNTNNAPDGSHRVTYTVSIFDDNTVIHKCKGYYRYVNIAPLTGAKLVYEYNWTSESPKFIINHDFLVKKGESIHVPNDRFHHNFKFTGTCTINGAQKTALTNGDISRLESTNLNYGVTLTYTNGVLKDENGHVFKKSGAGAAKKPVGRK